MQPQSETQSLAAAFAPRLVARLHREGFEGTLRMHSGGATRVVYFRRGDIASAASNAEADRLHNIFIREGRLTEPQVEMARSRQRPGASLGKVLIELGFLTPSELLQGARRQVRQILAACFALTDGTWQATPGPLGPEVTNLGLPVRRLIFDALLETGDRRAIVREMGSMESVYAPAAGLGDALAALRLEPAMEEIARMIDGRATLREISGRTSLDDFTVSRIVLALDILGLAAPANRPEPAVAPGAGRVIPVESDAAAGASITVLPAEEPAAAVAVAPPAATAFGDDGPRPLPRRGLDATGAPGTVDTMRPSERVPPAASAAPAGPAAPEPSFDREGPPLSTEEEMARARPAFAQPTSAPSAPPDFASDEPPAFAPAVPPAAAPSAPADPPLEAEPPPFPRHELPAFAGGTQGESPHWVVNPETGERVHEGPIELTFDGPLSPARSGGSPARWIAAVGAAVVVVASIGVALYMRSGVPDPAIEQVDAASEPPAAAAPAPESAGGREVAAAPGDRGGPAAEDGAPAPASGQESGDHPPSDAVAPPSAPNEIADAQPPVTAAPGPAPESAPHPRPRADADRLGPGHALLDAGDVSGAAAAFASALDGLPADHLSLHLMIACEEGTVRKARAAVAADDPLFVTRYSLRERSCYRLLWGLYGDRAAAETGAGTVPPYFTGSGVRPTVVSIGRLRGAA